jgi:dihydrofolate reductase
MSEILLYIAASLDGFIAERDGGVAWLESFDHGGEDYGYADFYARVGGLIMGGATYRQVLGFGAWPYAGVPCTVVTRRGLGEPPDAGVQAFSGDVAELVSQIQTESDRDVWLVGGGDLVGQFQERGLIDKYILSIMPVVLGEGIPLFPGQGRQEKLALVASRAYPSGVVQLTYQPERPGPAA